VEKDFIVQHLDDYGLNNYEARVYSALFEKKRLTAAEVARLAGIPRTRAYDNLRSLELKGLCEVITGKTRLYSAVSPSKLKEILVRMESDQTELRIQKYQEEIKKEKDRLVEKIKNTENLVEKLTPIFEKSRENEQDLDFIEIIKNNEQIHAKTCECMNNAQKEILTFSKPPFIGGPMQEEQWKAKEAAMVRGVPTKSIAELPQDKDKWKRFIIDVKESLACGEEVKVAEKLPMKLIVIDMEIVMYIMDSPLSNTTSFTMNYTKHPAMAELARAFFFAEWEKAKDSRTLLDKI